MEYLEEKDMAKVMSFLMMQYQNLLNMLLVALAKIKSW